MHETETQSLLARRHISALSKRVEQKVNVTGTRLSRQQGQIHAQKVTADSKQHVRDFLITYLEIWQSFEVSTRENAARFDTWSVFIPSC